MNIGAVKLIERDDKTSSFEKDPDKMDFEFEESQQPQLNNIGSAVEGFKTNRRSG